MVKMVETLKGEKGSARRLRLVIPVHVSLSNSLTSPTHFHWLPRFHRLFFSFADFNRANGVVNVNDSGIPARANRFDQMAQFLNVTIRFVAGNHLLPFIGGKAQRFLAASEVIIGGGIFEIDGVAHAEAESVRHRPASLGVNERA